jgi:hypothetical protein
LQPKDLFDRLCDSLNERFNQEAGVGVVCVNVETGQDPEDAVAEATADMMEEPDFLLIVNTNHPDVEVSTDKDNVDATQQQIEALEKELMQYGYTREQIEREIGRIAGTEEKAG